MDDSLLGRDALDRLNAERSNNAFLAALRQEAPSSDKLIWREPFQGNQWTKGSELSETARRQQASLANSMAAKEAARAKVVNRDPCPKCGVRRDLGCKHYPRRFADLRHEHVNEAWDAAIIEAREMHRRKDAA